MSEETAFSTSEIVIYIPLLNEGTKVVRPTRGIVLQPDVVRVLPTQDYDPALEEWEFPPGSTIRCVKENWEGREILVGRHRIA
jgi:hypothetical protein